MARKSGALNCSQERKKFPKAGIVRSKAGSRSAGVRRWKNDEGSVTHIKNYY